MAMAFYSYTKYLATGRNDCFAGIISEGRSELQIRQFILAEKMRWQGPLAGFRIISLQNNQQPNPSL
jgi:hypothetical protein